MRLALTMALAWADPQVGGPVDAAALDQVAVWLDLDELGRADALTRRAARSRGDDPRWIRARLDVLEAAGMEGWVQREIDRPNRSAEGRAAVRAWLYEHGRVSEPPGGPDGAAAVVRRALAAGEVERAEVALASLSEADRPALALAVAAARGDRAFVVDAASGWNLRGDPAALAALWAVAEDRAVKAARKAVLADVDAWIAEATPAEAVRLSRLLLAIGDRPRLEALSPRVAAVDLQALMDALAGDAATFDAFQLPPRPRWGRPMLSATLEALSRHESPSLPWLRPSERALVAFELTEALADAGRGDAAAELREQAAGPCWSQQAWRRLADDDEAGARAAMREDLLRCVGTLELVPQLDPAGVDLLSSSRAWAEGWARYGRAAQDLGRYDEAGVAAAVALWLEPSWERLGVARDANGGVVPTMAEMAARVEAAPWLRPLTAVEADRAERARARTVALLQPDARTLAAMATPLTACVPTLRSRCMLEHATVALAAREQGLPTPEVDLDPGAVRQAELWWADLRARRFEAEVQVRRLLDDQARRVAPPASSGGVVGGVVQQRDVAVIGRVFDWSYGSESSTSHRGAPVLLTFWASWCPPCVDELAWLRRRVPAWREEGVELDVVAVGLDRDEKSHQSLAPGLARAGFQVVHLPEGPGALDVRSLPVMLLLEPNGVVRAVHRGWGRSTEDWLEQEVTEWLASGAEAGGGG